MQRYSLLFGFCTLLCGCALQQTTPEKIWIGVMIDNHQDARAYQRGLDKAPLVEEFLVEGYITRFLAVFATDDLPDSIGPIRSVRPYFIDGSSPLLSAIMHVGGSPEALEKLETSDRVTSFNAIHMDNLFEYDDEAPAPHNRFLLKENMATLISRIEHPVTAPDPLTRGSLDPGEPAASIAINFHSRLHDLAYAYDTDNDAYRRTAGGIAQEPSPRNLLILETEVEEVGPIGRLRVVTEGTGALLLFREGGMTRGIWHKPDDNAFYEFMAEDRTPLPLGHGQTWVIVLDDLDRVSWEP